jgi:hypothetical protein
MSEGLTRSRWLSRARLAVGLAFYAYAAILAIGSIVGAIVDYDRHFASPKFHLSPWYAVLVICIASAALVYIAIRVVALLIRSWISH